MSSHKILLSPNSSADDWAWAYFLNLWKKNNKLKHHHRVQQQME